MRSALLVGLLALVACQSSSPEGTAEEDFVSRGGATLRSVADPDLRVSLLMLDGVQPSTRHRRFLKAVVFRGDKSFDAFCTLRGEVSEDRERAIVGCGIEVSTVSGDDDESLGFDFVLTRAAGTEMLTLENVFYSGDGTFLGTEAEIIGHEGAGPVTLTKREASNVEKNPLALGRVLLDAFKPLLADRMFSEEVASEVDIKAASFRVDAEMTASASFRLGLTGQLSEFVAGQSVLSEPGNLASGTAPANVITARVKEAFPKK
jgi:hypothetical protein